MEQIKTTSPMPPTQPVINEPNGSANTRTVVMAVVITAIITALVVAGAMYWFFSNNAADTEAPIEIYNSGEEEIVASSPTPNTVVAGTYTNAAAGFSLTLPNGWEAADKVNSADGSSYTTFSSPTMTAEAAKNQEYCADTNDSTPCAPGHPGASVQFSRLATASAGEKSQVTIGSYTWTKTIVAQSLNGEHEYSMKFPDGNTYAFTVFSDESEFLEALKTFQLK